MASLLNFAGRVAVVTGAGGGLGREYALLLASRGASVVVNDLGGSTSGEGKSTKAADVVVDQIVKNGGKAVANYDSVENGDNIIKTAISNFGRIDIVINNAGILRDKSFLKQTEQDWDLVHKVHLKGAFSVTKAAWPYFREQNFGRIIMTSSSAGVYGNFGQANYSSAKLGLLGLSNTLAVEGAKYNINSNTIVPIAASRLTQDILPPNLFEQLQPKYVAPLVAWLCHEDNEENGSCFEVAGGFIGKYKLQRTFGKTFIPPDTMTPEKVRDSWPEIIDSKKFTTPASIHDQMSQLLLDLSGEQLPEQEEENTSETKTKSENGLTIFEYKASDAILYALSVGVSTTQPDHLNFIYENSDDFQVLPTFGIGPSIDALLDSDVIGKACKKYSIEFNPTKLLHGEQYLEVFNEIPTNCKTKSEAKLIEVLDKGSGAVVIAESTTYDSSGNKLFYNQAQLFLVGSGGFGGNKKATSTLVKAILARPDRSPDEQVIEKTSIDQAALYRLCGDRNPLHIDPQFSVLGGYERPILHGLCTLAFTVRHVLSKYANNNTRLFKAVKARFAGTILPGQTIRTEMWQEGNRIFYESYCEETGKLVISGAYVDLHKVVKTNDNIELDSNKL